MGGDKYVFAPIEVFQDGRLSKIQLRVLLALWSFRDRKTTRPIHPKRKTLALRAGYSMQIISRTTTQLSTLGWLSKVGLGGRSMSCVYELHVPDFLLKTVTDSDRVSVADTVFSADLGDKRVIGSVTDTGSGTVTDSVTVPRSDTVTGSGTKTVTGSGTKTVTGSVTGNKQTKITDHKNIANNIERRFSLFWARYPRKENKARARERFLKMRPDAVLFEKIMVGLETYIIHKWDDQRFIPHGVTWLNQSRWEDEIAPVREFDGYSNA